MAGRDDDRPGLPCKCELATERLASEGWRKRRERIILLWAYSLGFKLTVAVIFRATRFEEKTYNIFISK